jgi:hypothetical protein
MGLRGSEGKGARALGRSVESGVVCGDEWETEGGRRRGGKGDEIRVCVPKERETRAEAEGEQRVCKVGMGPVRCQPSVYILRAEPGSWNKAAPTPTQTDTRQSRWIGSGVCAVGCRRAGVRTSERVPRTKHAEEEGRAGMDR